MRIPLVSLLRIFLHIWHLWVTMHVLSFRYLLEVAPLRSGNIHDFWSK